MRLGDTGFERITRHYVQLLHVLFAFSPSVAILYLAEFQTPGLRYENHVFHETAIGLAITASLFVTYITWRCYRESGEPLLRWLTLAFLGFSLVYAPHGIFTALAHEYPLLFLLYGPASRLVMNACLLVGILHHGRPTDTPATRNSRRFWLGWTTAFLLADLLVAWLALSSAARALDLRLAFEWSALGFALGGLFLMLRRNARLPLLAIYALAMAMFAQSSLSFIVAQAWNHQWWLAHAISAAGFLLLSYGVVRAFQTTRSFSTVYSQETIMRQLQTANDELTRMATTDALTGIANRRYFMDRANMELARSERAEIFFSLIALDLDHFKKINDEYGHQAGDRVLRQVSTAIGEMLRSSDLFGRLGGEEFCILLPETQLGEAVVIAHRIRQRVANLSIKHGERSLHVSISLGVAEYPSDGANIESLYGEVDRRLYAAKAAGRNCVSPTV